MTLGTFFWVAMIVVLLFNVLANWPSIKGGEWRTSGSWALIYLLLFVLGWHAFGPPIR